MSDTRPRRIPREPAQSETILGKTPVETPAAPIETPVETPAAAGPEVLSEVAPVEAEPAGPACPVPSALSSPPALPSPPAPPLPPALPSPQSTAPAKPAPEDVWAAFTKSQSALARGAERMAVEMTAVSRAGLAAAADAAVALLGARTVAEAIEINAGLARRGADSMLEASARLSEIVAVAVADAYRPILARFVGASGNIAAD